MTACPTGIAHTYMAAEALEAAAEQAGVDLQVETQGSAGSTPLSPDTIAGADAVIFAVDVGVRDRGRFAGKPVVTLGREAPDRRGRRDDRRGAPLRRRPERAAGRGRGRFRDRRRRPRPGDLGRPDPAGADDRRVLHDPVRRRGRPDDRPRLPVRWVRDRGPGAGRSCSKTRSGTCPTSRRSASSTRCSTRLLRLHRRPAAHHRPDGVRSSSSRRSPATSPTRSPTGPGSPPAS